MTMLSDGETVRDGLHVGLRERHPAHAAFARIEAKAAEALTWEEREAAVCPEDVPFEELIEGLRKRVRELEDLPKGSTE